MTALKNGKAFQVMVSCGPDQVALDAADWAGIRGKSPFAKTLIKALGVNGLGDINSSSNRDGVISVAELRVYVWDQVEKISSEQLEIPPISRPFSPWHTRKWSIHIF